MYCRWNILLLNEDATFLSSFWWFINPSHILNFCVLNFLPVFAGISELVFGERMVFFVLIFSHMFGGFQNLHVMTSTPVCVPNDKQNANLHFLLLYRHFYFYIAAITDGCLLLSVRHLEFWQFLWFTFEEIEVWCLKLECENGDIEILCSQKDWWVSG